MEALEWIISHWSEISIMGIIIMFIIRMDRTLTKINHNFKKIDKKIEQQEIERQNESKKIAKCMELSLEGIEVLSNALRTNKFNGNVTELENKIKDYLRHEAVN